MNISTKLLDHLVEKELSSLCFFYYDDESSLWIDQPKHSWQLPKCKYRGTGFFITPHGHVLTNKHVIEANLNPTVFLQLRGKFVQASLIDVHPTEDLALLKIEKPNNIDLPYLTLSSTAEGIGNWIFSLRGKALISDEENGINLLTLPSMGKLVAYTDSFAYTSITANPGNSGSPVLNLQGKVIGIITGMAIHPEMGELGISAVLPVRLLKDWVEEALRSDGYFYKLE